MNEQQILEVVERTLAHGWSGNDEDVVPDHIRDGYIEATYYPTENYTPSRVIRIRVEVVAP